MDSDYWQARANKRIAPHVKTDLTDFSQSEADDDDYDASQLSQPLCREGELSNTDDSVLSDDSREDNPPRTNPEVNTDGLALQPTRENEANAAGIFF